jgi:hypothetical protein
MKEHMLKGAQEEDEGHISYVSLVNYKPNFAI